MPSTAGQAGTCHRRRWRPGLLAADHHRHGQGIIRWLMLRLTA